jgi:hypothetical protein
MPYRLPMNSKERWLAEEQKFKAKFYIRDSLKMDFIA